MEADLYEIQELETDDPKMLEARRRRQEERVAEAIRDDALYGLGFSD